MALKAGFARIDLTPPLGTSIQGYFEERLADGILDPLYATAVAFDDGSKRAVIMSVDVIGFGQPLMERARKMIAEAIGTDKEGVFICCTHTHLGPGLTVGTADGVIYENEEYLEKTFLPKLKDAAFLAVQDLVPAKLSYTRGTVKDVAFIRRFRMKDGTAQTNPGWQNPNVAHPIGEPDENSSLLIIKRENAPEIGIVNFQVHPDVIHGCKFSADYPKFVRDTYEKLIENSRCMYINGPQGDTNHVDIRRCGDETSDGYKRSEYMGRKIAMSVVADYELAKPLEDETIKYAQKSCFTGFNKGRPDQIAQAKEISALYREKGSAAVGAAYGYTGMYNVTKIAEAERIVKLMDYPDEKELYLTAVSVGDVVFAGFPGEPFTDIGRSVKEKSKFTLTVTACCANGYEGYYPMQSAYDEGGYEASTARYVAGTAEKLIETSTQIINSL